jgi:hypothetical protein
MAIGLLSFSIAPLLREVGSRFRYDRWSLSSARAAFGRFVGFEIGWMMWFRARHESTRLS